MSETTYLLLTGASSGIGRDMAVQLSADRRLILHGRNAERLEETRAACARPDEHLVWRYDLGDAASIADDFGAFLAEHDGAVDGFVHCAGMLQVLPLRSLPLDVVRTTFEVNFFSALELTRALTKRKVNKRHLSSIVFISTIASQFGAKGFSAYSASKGALDALMKSLAVELAPRVRVNSVLPGGIRTAMTAEIFAQQEMVEKFERDYPLGIGESDDVANMVAFLLSDQAKWITGQQLVVDGGRTSNITA